MADRRQVLRFGALAAGVPAVLATATPALAAPGHGDKPSLVVGHRGASGYRPEHTLASYELAARLGADFIEPDLVATKDHVLVARHEPEIGGTTDVATRPEFAGRKRTVLLDGISTTGWFTHDFTLAELKTLRAVERLPAVRRNTLYNGLFEAPTFQEMLDLRGRLSKELGPGPGRHPGDQAPHLLPRARPGAHRVKVNPVFLTSAAGTPFNDTQPYAQYLTPAGLKELSTYVNGIGPDKAQVIPRNADNTLGAPTSLVKDAHAAGLKVIPYTFRAENQFLPADYQVGADPNAYGRAFDEQIAFLNTGIDGLFTDQADIGVPARSLRG